MRIKFLSWNIWIDGKFDEVCLFLKHTNADIIALQEVQDDIPDRKIIGFLKQLGYDYIFAPVSKEWDGKVYRDGPAIFSKLPIRSKEKYILSSENPRAAAKAEIAIDSNSLHVFSTHLIHTHQEPSQLQEEQVENLIKLIPKENVIVAGDFNALPESNTIRSMNKALKNIDSENKPTWSLHLEGCEECHVDEIKYRLDYIFLSNNLKYSDYRVESSRASDHLPISVVIELE